MQQDLQSRLKVCWRKIYRGIIKEDANKTGFISVAKFATICHQQSCFVSREELSRLMKQFGEKLYDGKKRVNFLNDMVEDLEDIQFNDSLLNYEDMSQSMGLHHSYLDSIKSHKID